MPPPGGLRSSLKQQVSQLTSASAGGYALSTQDMTQFASVFLPQGGIFSPGYPLAPADPRPVRGFDYAVGQNINFTPRNNEPVSFAQLRALAESHDLTRLAIETRKDQLEKLDWTIKPRDERKPATDAAERCAKLSDFWRFPDGMTPFATWMRLLVEDLLVLDAPVLEVRRTRGGQVIGLDVVDGSTIKLLIDDTGRRPAPPAPAFSQIIHGRPWRLLSNDELIYAPRNPRPQKLYGFSPVEQIIMTVNIGLRRQLMQLRHFTDGNVPAGLINAPDGWSPDQLAQYQDWFNSILAGNIAARQQVIWGPNGARYQAFREAPIKDEFDEWLARVVCYAFSLPPTAFVRQVNRATAESAQSAALEEGLAPLMGWIKRLADHVIQFRMGQPDLEFAWADVQPIDPSQQAEIIKTYVSTGVYTLDEARDLLGAEPYDGDIGNIPLIITGAGITRLQDAVQEPTDPIELAHATATAQAQAKATALGGMEGGGGADGATPSKPTTGAGTQQGKNGTQTGAKPAAAKGKPADAKSAAGKPKKPGQRMTKAEAGYAEDAAAAALHAVERLEKAIAVRDATPAPLPAEPKEPVKLDLVVNVDARRSDITKRTGTVKRNPDGSLSLDVTEQ